MGRAGWSSSRVRPGSASPRCSTSCERQLPDARWAWGACDGLFTPRPLAPLLDIGGRLDGDLGSLLRDGASPDQLFSALLRDLVASDRLIVLAIEDVHWADEATLDLLRFLGRRIRHARALILVTYRDEGLAADDEFRIAVGELSTQRSTRRMSLPALSEEAVAALADGSGVQAGGLHRLTGGNPFFVTEILQTTSGELPASVRDAVLARVAGLTDDARRALEVASLLGDRMEPSLLVSVTGAAPATIDELVNCGILVGEGTLLRFRHEIARTAVRATIPPHRSAAAHREILDVLLREGRADEARLALPRGGGRRRRRRPRVRTARRATRLRARLAPRGGGAVRPGDRGGLRPRPTRRARASTRRWPTSSPCSTDGWSRPTSARRRSGCGDWWATRGGRATTCVACPAPCGGCAVGTRRSGPRSRRWRPWSPRAPAPSWRGSTPTWPTTG